MTLLGPSGCGKTTLLNLVAGFLEPDRGEIAIDGRRITDLPTYRREIGIMFQSYALFPHMSVAANVGYGLKMRRTRQPEIARRVAEALALVKLAGLEDRRPRQLSGGQQQRVALARALVIRPEVLLLDEPFSALDRNLRASMQVEIKEIQRKLGVTTIFVTHDQSEALSLSDRIAVIAEGRIRQLGTPDEIYRRPADRFVASFVGDVNVLRCSPRAYRGATAMVALGPVQLTVPARTAARVLHLAMPSTCSCGRRICAWPSPAGRSRHTAPLRRKSTKAATSTSMSTSPEAASGRVLLRVPGHEACRAGRPARASASPLPRTRRSLSAERRPQTQLDDVLTSPPAQVPASTRPCVSCLRSPRGSLRPAIR